MLKKTNSILLGLSVLAALVGVGHAISCLVYGHGGHEGLRGTPTVVVECGSAVTTCKKISIAYTWRLRRLHWHLPVLLTPAPTAPPTRCNSAFGAVRAAAPL
uniref:Secreted protein n=1 Tax=Macrostomum lignano TaxID=282301 RepID=A0A1I8F4V1_9PLAT